MEGKKNKRKEHPLNGGYKTPLLKVAGLLEGNSDRRLLIGHLSLSASIFVSYQLFQQNCPFLLSASVFVCIHAISYWFAVNVTCETFLLEKILCQGDHALLCRILCVD